jgi:CBS domain-containing protein
MQIRIHVPHMTELRAMRASTQSDVFDEIQVFHEALRDVAVWMPTIVDEKGQASPRDARWLRAFLRGPLRWHLYDEEIAFLPRLAHAAEDRGPNAWLERCVALARTHHAAMRSASESLLGSVDDLSRGERVDVVRWRADAGAVARTFDGALAFEDDILLPTARLLFDGAARASLRDELHALDAGRPWDDVEVAGDVPTLHRIHGVSTRRREGEGEVVRAFAACPRGRTVSTESTCRNCPELERFGVDANGRAVVACAMDEAARDDGDVRVRDVMTRDVRCVTPSTTMRDALAMFARNQFTGVPVVDDHGHPIGMLSQTDVVRALVEGFDVQELDVAEAMMHVAFVVKEDAPLEQAIELFEIEGVHRLPVVNADGVVVGILSPRDLMRARFRDGR